MARNVFTMINNLQKTIERLSPDSPYLKAAMHRVGLYVVGLAKIEALRKGVISSGRLVNSLRYEFFRRGSVVGISIGSFGVPYAAMNEFGGRISPRQYRAMMARLSRNSRHRRASKGVVRGNPQTGGTWRARPFLRPAFAKSRPFVVDTLRAALSFSKGR
jgi:phage gpG-like protein